MQYRYKKIDFTSPASAQGGPGIQKSLTWYVGTPYLNMTAAQFQAVSAAVGATLGDIWTLGGSASADSGNCFMFVKVAPANEFGLGMLVTPETPSSGTITVPLSTTVMTTDIDESAVGVNQDVDNWFFGNVTGAALPQLRRIKANNAAVTATFTVSQHDFMRPNSPNDADVFDTTPTAADPACVMRPWNVEVCTATTVPIGVALGTATAGHYTIIQVYGLAMVSAIGDTTALVVNQPAVPAAAGQIAGSALAVDNLYLGAGQILPQFATAAGAPGLLIPCFVNFSAQ